MHAGEVPGLCQGVGCSEFCKGSGAGCSEFYKGSGTFPEAHSSFLPQDIVWQPQRCRTSPWPWLRASGWAGEHPPPRSTALLPCCVHAATRGAIFVPFLLFIVPEQCAVGEGCGVCFVIASFPPITFCLKTGFALILDPRPGNLGSMPRALALQGSWGTEIPGSDPDFDPKLSANTPHCPSAPLGTNCSPESPPLEHPQPLPSASSSTSTATLAPSLWNAQLPKADRWVSGNDRGEPSNRSHHERGGKN